MFLEQPDTLNFDFAPFQQLASAPDAAIAALQQQMLDDAGRPLDYELGKFQTHIDSYRKHKDDARLNAEIERAFGSGGINDLNQMFTDQKGKVDATMELYQHSEYISAFDYLFLMLNLQGIRTPFWNIESLERRNAFSVPETAEPAVIAQALAPRDEYWT